MQVEESRKVATTIRLPRSLYTHAKSVVRQRVIEAETFNELVELALRACLNRIQRMQIDRAIMEMAADTDYQKEAQMLTADFEQSDWEALEITEVDAEGHA